MKARGQKAKYEAKVPYEREDSGTYKKGAAEPDKVLHDKD